MTSNTSGLQHAHNLKNIIENADAFGLSHQLKIIKKKEHQSAKIIIGDIASLYASLQSEHVLDVLSFLNDVDQVVIAKDKWKSIINFCIRSFEFMQQTT